MNNYEAANVIEMGQAHGLILGPKPTDDTIDSDLEPFKRDVVSDIDDE